MCLQYSPNENPSNADQWEGPRGATPPPHFLTKMRPKGPKKNFFETQGLDLQVICR